MVGIWSRAHVDDGKFFWANCCLWVNLATQLKGQQGKAKEHARQV